MVDWERWKMEYEEQKKWISENKAKNGKDKEKATKGNGSKEKRKDVDAMNVDVDVIEIPDPMKSLSAQIQHKAHERRHRYKLKLKIQILNAVPEIREALAKANDVPVDAIPGLRVREALEVNSGVPASTIDKWMRNEGIYRKLYLDKFNRKKENFGSGRHPFYPKAEASVATLVKDRRKEHRTVSKALVVDELSKEAKKEKPDIFKAHPISDDIFFGFLWRNGFSFRLPSSIKALSKVEAAKRVRGFWNWFRRLLSGEIPIEIGLSDAIDSKYGRFLPFCRKNKDEVPGIFGDSHIIISLRGEGATIQRAPEGWGDRYCTWILLGGPDGLDDLVGIVFKGTGLKLKQEEFDYYKELKNVVVMFQENAWVDGKIELKVVDSILKPMVTKVKEKCKAKAIDFPGVVLIEDNFKPHFAEYVLALSSFQSIPNRALFFRQVVKAKLKMDIYPVALPALCTDVAQWVDDNTGKDFKHDVARKFTQYLVDFDWNKNPSGKIPAPEKRRLMAKFTNEAAGEYNARHKASMEASSMRTGLYMTIDKSDIERMRPVGYDSMSHS